MPDMNVTEAPRSHREIIQLLDGPTAVAHALDITPAVNTTLHWASRGIPAKHWHSVASLLAKRGHELTAADLASMHPNVKGRV